MDCVAGLVIRLSLVFGQPAVAIAFLLCFVLNGYSIVKLRVCLQSHQGGHLH